MAYDANATDDGENTDTLTYSLSAGGDNDKFNINSSTGEVTFKVSPNFEAPTDVGGNNVYDIVVHANDGTLDTTKAVAISVTNVNEAPTAVVLSNTVASTPENGGSLKVADIAVTDDALGTNALSLSGADSGAFSLVGNALYFNGGANYEAKSSYDVTVNVNDAGVGGNPDASQNFTLTITNVNTAPAFTSGATANDCGELGDRDGGLRRERRPTTRENSNTLTYSLSAAVTTRKFKINSATAR